MRFTLGTIQTSIITFLITAFICLSVYAANKQVPVIDAEVDKESVRIGDRIKLRVTAKGAAGSDVIFPEKPEDLGVFSLMGSYPVKSGLLRPRVIGREYIMSVYTTGPQDIPPIKVSYREKGKDDWRITESPVVSIEVTSLLTGNDIDIKDIKGLIIPGRGRAVSFGLFLALFAAVLALLMLRQRYLLRAEERRIGSKPAHLVAYEELTALKAMDLPGKGRVKEYYIRLSDIVRRYLENRFSYRAPEMTTEEFMDSIKRSSELRDDHKKLLKDFLFHCDMVKFAKYGPTPIEILDSYSAAERLIDQTRIEEEGEKKE